MTNDELKRALITGVQVVCEKPGEIPIMYARVSGILYKRKEDMFKRYRDCCQETTTPGIVVCAELQCGSGHSVTYADPKWVRLKEGG